MHRCLVATLLRFIGEVIILRAVAVVENLPVITQNVAENVVSLDHS